MTQNRRIVVNFLATYGRSVFAFVCGLFSGRWLLMSLGEVDYGLFGVVGGLTSCVTFFNSLLAGAVSRYYAFHVGAASVSGEAGLEECRKWFTTAVLIHTVLPLILIVIGYPIGAWAVRDFLTIPPDRVADCIWVWRFVCINCFVGMVNVPYVAMYGAKQEIAETTLYSIVPTALNVCVLYYMVSHEGTWLVFFAAVTCILSVVPRVIMGVRAVLIYPECRFRLKYIRCFDRIKELATFASLRFAGACTMMIQGQGMSILTNKFLGPARNAAMTVGRTLSVHSQTLASALDTALSPAITNACGAGDYKRMRTLCFQACKFGTVLMLIFALPLSLEVNEVMRLWLKNPPEFAASLCVCMLVFLVLEKMSAGLWMSIFAIGRIGWYQLSMSVCGIVVLPMAWLLMKAGFDLMAVGYALVFGRILACGFRLWFGQRIGTMSAWKWIRQVFIPIATVSAASLAAGCVSVALLPQSFLRIVVTTVAIELVLLPLCWLLVFTVEERAFLLTRIRAKFQR